MQPLSDAEKTAIRDVYSHVARSRNFSPREAQKTMIGAVAQAFANDAIGVIEAPPGVGKSLGYLIPATTLSVLRGHKTVVSTATVALQHQLQQSDLPSIMAAVEATCGIHPTISLSRGRGRFVCLLKVEFATRQGDLFADSANRQAARQVEVALHQGWTGDIDSAPSLVDRSKWDEFANDRHSCISGHCPHFAKCPYFVAQEKLRDADVVITNHDKLLRSLAQNDVNTTGEPQETVYIFDEAHHLPEKALSTFASSADCDVGWLRPLLDHGRKLDLSFTRLAKREFDALSRHMAGLRLQLEGLAGGKNILRMPEAVLAANIADPIHACRVGFERIEEALQLCARANDTAGSDQQIWIRSFSGRLSDTIAALKAFQTHGEGVMQATWFERSGRDWSAKASPFRAGATLDRILWQPAKAAILTSATLRPCASFKPMLASLGLVGNERLVLHELDSPFDFTRAKLLLPKTDVAPRTPEHNALVTTYVNDSWHVDVATLVIFSARAQMMAVYDGLNDAVQECVLHQDAAPVAEIVRRHRDRIDAGLPSVIFGLKTMSEGIDLPGHYLTRVILTTIGFPHTDDPIIAAATEYLTSRNYKAFPILHLPYASIGLTQTFGRLIRTETDWGEVIILDNRLRTKSYGRQLLATLPVKAQIVTALV